MIPFICDSGWVMGPEGTELQSILIWGPMSFPLHLSCCQSLNNDGLIMESECMGNEFHPNDRRKERKEEEEKERERGRKEEQNERRKGKKGRKEKRKEKAIGRERKKEC